MLMPAHPAWSAVCALRVYEPAACPQFDVVHHPALITGSWTRGATDCTCAQQRELRINGQTYRCPQPKPLLEWESLHQVRQQFPERLVAAIVSPSQSEHITQTYEQWRLHHDLDHSHTRTARWQVPLAWFALFSADERLLSAHSRPGLAYRARMSAARRRTARALRIVPSSLAHCIGDNLEELSQWLAAFHSRSWVELDADALSTLLPSPMCGAADPAALWERLLAAAQRGDPRTTGRVYEQLAAPWGTVSAWEHVN